MATVTGFTAERMLAIENASVVDGEVVGDNLILTRFDESTINAGNVRGPQGIEGPIGEVSQAELDTAIPVGVIADFIGTVPPALWLSMVGQTIVNGESLLPALWEVLPANMKSGSNIIMPDTRGRVSVGHAPLDSDFNVIGEVGGEKEHLLSPGELPGHTHGLNSPFGVTDVTRNGGTPNFWSGSTALDDALVVAETDTQGNSEAHNNLQPYVVFLKIIKAA